MAKTNILGKIKNLWSGLDENKPGVEFFPASKTSDVDEAFENFLYTTYKDAFKEVVEKNENEWSENRKAYMSRGVDHHAFKDAIFTDTGTPNIYCSSVVADKIEDIVSIQLSGRPTVYPLPTHNPNFNYAPYLKENESPGDFVRNLWTCCFKDLQERMGMQEQAYKEGVEARLTGYVITKQTQAFDFDTKEQDVSVEICVTEDVAYDPDAKTFEENRYLFHRLWKTPYEALTLYPDYGQEIMDSVGITHEDRMRKKGEGRPQREKRNLVCIVEAYLRDLTLEEQEVYKKIKDPTTGADLEIVSTQMLPKYPNGRRITFLDGSEIEILKDEPNPYPTFPFTKFVPKPVSWSQQGRTEATPLRALQYADDFIIQQMMVNVKKMGNGSIIYDRKGVQDIANLSGHDVEKIPVDYLGAIQYHAPENVTLNAERAHAVILAAARDISGIEAPSEGRAPGSITSGIGVSLLQEGTNRKIRPSRDIYVEFLARKWKQIGDIMRDLYQEGRVLRVSDDDGLPVRLPVNLFDVTDSIDVKTDSDTTLPSDPVSMANLALTLLQVRDENGVPIIDREYLSQWLKLPGLRESLKRIEMRSQMKATDDMMSKMGPPQPTGPEQAMGAETNMAEQMPGMNAGNAVEDQVSPNPGGMGNNLAMRGFNT